MGKKLALLLCLGLLALLLFGAYYAAKRTEDEQIQNAGTVQNGVQRPVSLTYQGQAYPLKKHIQTVLLIGTDSDEQYQQITEGLRPFYNYHQADFLMLLVLDADGQRVEIIQLNRDTMTDVPWLDVLGKYGGTEYKQLCLAFNYGDGGTASCKNTVNAVSGLLFDAPIQGYIQIPMSAIPALNDLVGGVPVTMTEDLTMIDPAFVQGATVRLTGAQAEAFVRVRSALADDTNLSRMRRQREYLDSFRQRAKEALHSDSQFALELLDTLGAYMQTNLTGQQLTDLIEKLDTYQISPIRHPEGELTAGEQYYEFYADQDSLWEIVKASFCDLPGQR